MPCAVLLRIGKPLLGVLNRARRHVGEAHRAPLLEHGQRGMQRAGDDRGIEPRAFERLVARDVNQSTSTALGAQPWPTIDVTLPSFFG